MMYRSDWARSSNQEMILAITLRRTDFESILAGAVASSFEGSRFTTPKEWSKALSRSNVRLQWDPDHSPSGAKLQRRAVQLGMRGDTLRRWVGWGHACPEWVPVGVHASSWSPHRT
jgi:hypothetical protein